MDALAERLGVLQGNDKHLFFVTSDVNFDGILKLLEHVDLLLTSRFHGMVAGLSRLVPTMVVGWSHKYAEVLRQFEMEEMATDYAQAFSDTLNLLNRLIERRAVVAELMAQNLPRVRAEAERQFDYVIEDLA